jgi:hypothetical protein
MKCICPDVDLCIDKMNIKIEDHYCHHGKLHEYRESCNNTYCAYLKKNITCVKITEEQFITKEEILI